jgi:hypothetical protein
MGQPDQAAKQAVGAKTRGVEDEAIHERQTAGEPPAHAEEMAWARRYHQELTHFPGEFVALSARGVTAHDADFLRLMTLLGARQAERVYIVSVPAADALAV